MSRFQNIDTHNLHHAYLIEGNRDEIIEELFLFIKSFNIETTNNPDFTHIVIDNFKMDEALNLRSMGTAKSFTNNRKIFVLTANTFSLDAQQALLKLFEEPIEKTHFFVVVPEVDALIKTLISRFYVIKNMGREINTKTALDFLASPYGKRVEFIKELLTTEDEENIRDDSPRSNALKFLNNLESALHTKMSKGTFDTKSSVQFFQHIFKTREYLRQPGSATKTLLESVALTVPVLQ